MNALRELQRNFARAILQPGAPFSMLHELSRRRMEIYTDGYKTRLLEALRTNFTTLHRVLGDETFRDLAHGYIDAMPSCYRSIRWFGRELEAFARRDASLLPHAALLDLLRMDWAIGTALDAADAPLLSADRLRSVAPEQWAALMLAPHPSVTVLRLEWAVEPIWRVATGALSTAATAEQSEAPEAHPHHLLIWRDGLEARWRVMAADEACAFAKLAGGCRFGALCEYLVAQGNAAQAAQTAATYLARWVAHGVLADTLTSAATEPEQQVC